MKIPALTCRTTANTQKIINSIAFDDTYELIWVGDSNGYVYSYSGPQLHSYVSFKAHNSPVFKLLNHKRGILSLSSDSLSLVSKQGVMKFLIKDEQLNGATCMAYTSNTQTELLVAGSAQKMNRILRIDLTKGVISGSIPYLETVLFMESNLQYVVLGKANGTIDILDARYNRIVHSFRAHQASLASIHVNGDLLLTCGYSLRHESYVSEPLVNVFDLRNLKPLAPIAFPTGAVFAKIHPKLPSTAVILSQLGQITFIDIYNQARVQLYQTEITSYISLMDFSQSGDCIVFVDAMQMLHLWSNSTNPSFTVYPTMLEYASEPSQSVPPGCQLSYDADDNTPLNSVKLPHYSKMLLSAWPVDMKFNTGTLPKQIDPEILRKSKVLVDGIRLSPYDKNKYGARNTASKYSHISNKSGHIRGYPKFISERDDDDSDDDADTNAADMPNSNSNITSNIRSGVNPISNNNNSTNATTATTNNNNNNPTTTNNSNNNNNNSQKNSKNDPNAFNPFEYIPSDNSEIPNALRKIDIQYSKFGIDDFDFEFFNKTKYSGLETGVSNSYCNSVFQLYRFIPPFFNFSVSTLAEDSKYDDSILAELGYLFDMLVKGNGKHCVATNFQRLLCSLPEPKALSLLSEDGFCRNDYRQRSLIQNFNRYLLQKIAVDEAKLFNSNMSHNLNSICGIITETTIRSLFCPLQHQKANIFHCLEINSAPMNNGYGGSPTILNYMEESMSKIIRHTLYCEICKVNHDVQASLLIPKLSPVVIVNIDLPNDKMNEISNYQNWLVPEFYSININSGRPVLRTNYIAGAVNGSHIIKYELVGYIAQITTKENINHTVTYSRIKQDNGEYKWFLFNDFLVCPIDDISEVFNLSYWWKTPVTAVYKIAESGNDFNYNGWKQQINTEILYRDFFSAAERETKIVEYKLLTKEEAPRPGTIVGIDAEFVQLAPPEYIFGSNGKKTLVKPKKLSLARVSVIRGEGEKYGVPFIDDYIITNEHIDDYITSFSGIEPGDLDPNTSKRTLVPLQVAYRKLWLLLNLGCVFVGHSLGGDFRIINIQVPKNQIRDTAEFFYSKKEKRKLGLKFLIYFLFNERVQTGNHDSIEDAMSALQLYEKYLELSKQGTLESTINRIYLEGQFTRFRIPNA